MALSISALLPWLCLQCQGGDFEGVFVDCIKVPLYANFKTISWTQPLNALSRTNLKPLCTLWHHFHVPALQTAERPCCNVVLFGVKI